MIPRASDVGVVVGRFQVHKLHSAHEALITSVVESHAHTLIVLGLARVRATSRNPLDFEARKQMLLDAFPSVTVLYINDEASDAVWSKKLDELISDYVGPARSVCLYGGRDSFINHYQGKHQTAVLEPEVYASGTELRRGVARGRIKGSEDWRAGAIWAASNGYPKVYPTVDVIVYRTLKQGAIGTKPEWLLVRKPNETLWRFPGGFVDPTDASLEAAARREVEEETGLAIDGLTFVGSTLVDDWRYRDETDKIMTSLFLATHQFGAVRPADDIAEARWSAPPKQEELVPEHRPLLDMLMKAEEKGGVQ